MAGYELGNNILKETIRCHNRRSDLENEKAIVIPRSIRFTRSVSKTLFRCRLCNSAWSSHRTVITFDFRRQTVSRVWRQKCSLCDTINHPHLAQPEWIKFTEYACKFYLTKLDRFLAGKHVTGREQTETAEQTEGVPGRKPHESKLCEACCWGDRRCC